MLQNIDHIIVRLLIHKMFICFIFATRYTEKSYKGSHVAETVLMYDF